MCWHVMAWHGMAWHGMAWHVVSYHVMSCHVMSCHVVSCHVMSCHVQCCSIATPANRLCDVLYSVVCLLSSTQQTKSGFTTSCIPLLVLASLACSVLPVDAFHPSGQISHDTAHAIYEMFLDASRFQCTLLEPVAMLMAVISVLTTVVIMMIRLI